MLARGLAVANFESANSRGVCVDLLKSIAEKVDAPELTSGTLEIVVAVLEQVIEDWMDVTTSATSAGRAVLPMTKQADACLAVTSVGRAVERAR